MASEKANQFLSWLKEKYDIEFNDRFNIVDLVFEWEESLNKSKIKEEKSNNETLIQDYKVKEIDNQTWFFKVHDKKQKDQSRKLKIGDIIIYNATSSFGTMIIGSFDYDSDFAARAYFGTNNGRFYSGFAPGINKFRFATKEEIINFLESALANESNKSLYFNLSNKYVPEYIHDLLKKYNL